MRAERRARPSRNVVVPMGSFKGTFCRRLHPGRVQAIARRTRRSPRGAHATLSLFQVVMSLVYHVLQGMGRLSASVETVTGKRLGNSTLSARRRGMTSEFWKQVTEYFLCSRADPERHPEAFYKGMRLVGCDGTCFSLVNLPALVAQFGKAVSRRMKAAFAKVRVVTLVELGLHNPIAVSVGVERESENVLAAGLMSRLSNCLFLGDRLYAAAALVCELLGRQRRDSVEFLVRVSNCPKPRKIEAYADGSVRVEIEFGQERLRVREIRGRVCRRSGKWTSVRLWTSLLDPEKYPAIELLQLYGKRWEHEITYKELKRQLCDSPLLEAHTVPTAVQEILALVMAQSLVSEVRNLVAACSDVPVLEVSFPQGTVHASCLVARGDVGPEHPESDATGEAGDPVDHVPGLTTERQTQGALLPTGGAPAGERVAPPAEELAADRALPV